MGWRDVCGGHPVEVFFEKKLGVTSMASNGSQSPGEAGEAGGDDQREPRSGRALVTVDGVALAATLARQEQFQKTVEDFLAVSLRQGEALRRIIDRQEGVIASLRQQVAELSRREGGPAAPNQDDRSL